MQKNLEILISIKEREINEASKLIQEVQIIIDKNNESIAEIEAGLKQEREHLTSDATNIVYFDNFNKHQNSKISNLKNIIKHQEEKLAKMQDALREIFLEKKKYEILLKKLEEEHKKQLTKKEQDFLDDLNSK